MTLKDRIHRYFKTRPAQWISGAEIERLTQEKTKHIASTASRRLRELHEEGQLDREMRRSGTTGRKKIAWYRSPDTNAMRTVDGHFATMAQSAGIIRWFDQLP